MKQKFRAWIKGDEEMTYSWQHDCLSHFFSYLKQNWSITDYIIQQFTGLLDKTGKEIYEGDILEGFTYPVEFMMGSFGARILYDQIFLTLYNCPQEQLLILGNVFENPELLKNE